MKVYIAGPMSGYPQFNIPAFDLAAEYLRQQGFEVVSPAEVDGPELREVYMASKDGSHQGLEEREQPYSYYLDRDLEILRTGSFDAIVTLPNWERSPGANREVGFGMGHGIPQVEYEDYDPVLGFNLKPELYGTTGEFITFEQNPLRQRSVTGGVKDNRGKPPIDLFPYEAIRGAAAVLEFGARKYKPGNWRLGLSWSQTWSSLQRHLWAFNEGENLDQETGLPHLDHAMCQLAFLSTYFHTETGTDDRFSSSDPEASKA